DRLLGRVVRTRDVERVGGVVVELVAEPDLRRIAVAQLAPARSDVLEVVGDALELGEAGAADPRLHAGRARALRDELLLEVGPEVGVQADRRGLPRRADILQEGLDVAP